jgi:hypothetical protein
MNGFFEQYTWETFLERTALWINEKSRLLTGYLEMHRSENDQKRSKVQPVEPPYEAAELKRNHVAHLLRVETKREAYRY